MVEPVSAIGGLVVTGTKLCVSLNEITGAIREAPRTIQSIRNELFAVNAALCQIQTWFEDPKTVPPKNVQQDVRVISRSCKDTFKELGTVVVDLKPGAWSRVVWLTKEKQANELLRRIESHKASLNLVLTVVGGQTGARVEDRLDRMGYLLGHLVKSQKKVSKKLRAIEKTPVVHTAEVAVAAGPADLTNNVAKARHRSASDLWSATSVVSGRENVSPASPASGPSTLGINPTIVPSRTQSHRIGGGRANSDRVEASSEEGSSYIEDDVARSRLRDTGSEAGSSTVDDGNGSGGANDPFADPSSPLPTLLGFGSQRNVSVDHLHPMAVVSKLQDGRRRSIDSSTVSLSESELSGISDLTLSDLDLDELLRPGSIYSLASTAPSAQGPVARPARAKRRMPTLHEILARKTNAPWSLFDFYIYMRDFQRTIDYLDCWLDIGTHRQLCRQWAKEILKDVVTRQGDADRLDRNISEPNENDNNADVNADDDIASVRSGRDSTRKSDAELFIERVQWSLLNSGSSMDTGLELESELTAARSRSLSFRDLAGRPDVTASAQKILYTYILPGAEREVVLPDSMLNRVLRHIEEEGRDDPEVFDAVANYIFSAMEHDAYPYFMTRRRALRQNLSRTPLTMFRGLSDKFRFDPIAEEDPSTPSAAFAPSPSRGLGGYYKAVAAERATKGPRPPRLDPII